MLSSSTATWRGRLGRQPLEEQRREPARLLEVLGVRPRAVAELDRGPVAELAALRRSSAAAFGATSGAWPGAGTDRDRRPDMGVSLRTARRGCRSLDSLMGAGSWESYHAITTLLFR